MQPREVLQQVFGHAEFRGCQGDVIEHVSSGGHALVIMPTGMGKSLCYQVPALSDTPAPLAAGGPASGGEFAGREFAGRDAAGEGVPLTLVLSPLIALMKDQVDALAAKGVDAAFINSSLSRRAREGRYAAVAQGRHRLLYVTPERFRKPEFLEVLARRRVKLLAVDEAHCISEWGHDFRPDYTRLAEFRRLVGEPTTIALTATATPEVQRDIVRQLGLGEAEMRLFHEGIDRPNLTLTVQEVWGHDEKLDWILEAVRPERLGTGSGIVYFTLIKTLESFSDRLSAAGVAHVVYHGDLERKARRDLQEDFMEGREPLVLATNAFGMGIDKEDIRLVLHADLPGSLESYYQEIGRAGRDGQPSRCLLLYDQEDLTTQMEFVAWSNPDADYYARVFGLLSDNLDQVRAFGFEWLREKLHHRNRSDHRLDTVLSMLDRYGVVERDQETAYLELASELPPALADHERLAEKLRRDQQKLLALVQYVRHEGDRKAFIHEYFGLPYTAAPPA